MAHDSANLSALRAENEELCQKVASAEQRAGALSAELESARRELARAEAEGRATRSLLQTVVDTLDPMMICWKDKELVYRGCNRRAAMVARLEAPGDIVGKTDYDLPWKPEEAEAFRATDRNVMASNAAAHNIRQSLVRDGRMAWLRTTKVPLHDDAGNVSGILLTSEDITEQKQNELALKAEQDLTSAILSSSAFLVIVLDRRGSIVRFNPGCQAVTGYKHEEVKEKPFWDHLLTKAERESEKAEFEHLRADMFPRTNERFWSAKDGSRRLITWSHTALLGADGEVDYVIGTGIDITDSRRTESERAALQAQVIEAQRSALRELSTPLIPIADNVVAVPLVGAIDAQRAEQLIDTLLKGVAAHRASAVILDITGVLVVDTEAVNVFVQAAKALRLLGAQVIMTGIQPRLAETLVRVGADLEGVRTLGSLQAGIAAALKKG